MQRKLLYCGVFIVALALPTLGMAAPVAKPPDDDKLLAFTQPTDCFGIFFEKLGTQRGVGEKSCAKQIVRYQLDDINMEFQRMGHILKFARDAARQAGYELHQGGELDLKAIVGKTIEERKGNDTVLNQEDKGDFDSSINFFTVARGKDKTITVDGEALSFQVYKVSASMKMGFGTDLNDEEIVMRVAYHKASDGTVTRIIDGEVDNSFAEANLVITIDGTIKTKADGTFISRAVNIGFEDNFTGSFIECTDPLDPDSCTEKTFENSSGKVTSLQQTYSEVDGGVADTGSLVFTKSDSGGVVTAKAAAGGGTQNIEGRARWDNTGAGCFEIKTDFTGAHNDEGTGGDGCGPCTDGTDGCEAYRHGRDLAAILKAESKDTENDFGACEQGGSCTNFVCEDMSLESNDCADYCGDTNPQGAPDPQSCDTNTLCKMCVMGCLEGTFIEDSLLSDVFWRAECWDADGVISKASGDIERKHRDTAMPIPPDPKFGKADVHTADKAPTFEENTEHACAITFDLEKKVELDPSGNEICVPDTFKDSNGAAADTPLCSAMDPTQNPCG